jgi:DNA-binding NarL/FixJ family response regulator
MIRILIADDHRLVLDGLAQALDTLPDIEVVGRAGDGHELISLVAELRPDVLLVDIEMPRLGGLSALRRLGDAPPAVIVTMHADDEHRSQAARSGAAGFLSKGAPLRDLAAAVRAAHAGERFIDEDNLAALLARHQDPVLDAGAASLTARERELLRLLAKGVSSTEELAESLFISQKTVKNHLANIYEKLAVADRAQAAIEAIRLGLHRDDPK